MPEGGRLKLDPHLLLLAYVVFRRVKDGPPDAGDIRPFTNNVASHRWLRELLCLLPKGNGKTAFFAALAVFHLLTVSNANCYIGAADKEQAGEMYRFARHYVDSNPTLRRSLKTLPSTKEINSRRDSGFIKVLAADDSKVGNKKQGYNPTLALVDELHAHDNDNLYSDLRSGLFKRDGLIVTITTAGSDESSILGQLRTRMLAYGDGTGELVTGLRIDGGGELVYDPVRGRLTVSRAPNGRTVLAEWALRDANHPLGKDDPTDFATVKLASPASWVTEESIADAYESLSYARYCRWRCNLWAQADDTKIPAEKWDALNEGATIPDGADGGVLVIVDYARSSDATAVTQLWRRDDGRIVPQTYVIARRVREEGRQQPIAHLLVDEDTIRQSLVRQRVRAIATTREVIAVVYDPHLFDPEELSDEGFRMIEFPQSNERLVPAAKVLYEAIDQAGIVHDGDPVLRSHVIHAGTVNIGDDGWRFSKAKSKHRIDALITLVMGVYEMGRQLVSAYETRGLVVLDAGPDTDHDDEDDEWDD